MMINFHLILQYFFYFFIRAYMFTLRFKIVEENYKIEATSQSENGSYIFALWHGQVFGCLLAHAWKMPFVVMASRSKDGDYAAFISEKLGMICVRASSRRNGVDKGGKEGIEQFVSKLKSGSVAGMTVDGPKGPNQKCKPGVAIIANGAACSILPVSAVYSSFWEFERSWDKFRLPKPFSRVIVHYGPPISAPQETTPEKISETCALVEKNLAIAEKLATNYLSK